MDNTPLAGSFQLIPQDVLETLYVALAQSAHAVGAERRHMAWEWLAEHDRYDWMGR
jgi:hypothetical protein